MSSCSTERPIFVRPSAREKIEAAGGTVELLREKKVKKVRHHKAAAQTEETPEDTTEETAEATETPEPEGE